MSEIGIPVVPVQPRQFTPPNNYVVAKHRFGLRRVFEAAHRYSLGVFAVLFLMVGSTATVVGANYWTANIAALGERATAVKISLSPDVGLNLTVADNNLQTKLQSLTSETVSLTVGSQPVSLSPETISSWLKVTPETAKGDDFIHADPKTIAASLTQIADSYVKAPVDQVTTAHNDGTPAGIIEAGVNGTELSSSVNLNQTAAQIAKSLIAGQGIQGSLPLQTVPFQAVTPASFPKLLEVDVTTHRMYAYDNGNLTQSFLISAGAPATPTPLGEFKIWEKLPMQTMSGYNPNGTKYVQPNVQWINYFDHSGDAVHGNYWRPVSVFGSVNTSHGCVSLPNTQAEWVYNWAPIGTTVITHA